MRLAVAVKNIKPQYGPIADAIQKSGLVDIVALDDQSNWHLYDDIIIFYNKIPEVVNRPRGLVGWWMNDLRRPIDLKNTKSHNFDEIFICHKTFDEQYKEFFERPIHYMPQCGHSQPMVKGRRIDWDVVFIGKDNGKRYYHKDRASVLEALRPHCNLNVITGEGQTKDQHWVYNQTKINLAFSFPMQEGTSNRLYNILASGGFCLTRYYPGMEKQFKNHKHLAWFHSNDEAIKMIKYYLENEEERKKIAHQGYELYQLKHTASERLKNMFDIMKGIETKFRGYL